MGSTSIDLGVMAGDSDFAYTRDIFDRTNRCHGLLSTSDKMFYVVRTSSGVAVRVISNFDSGTVESSYNQTTVTVSNISFSTKVGSNYGMSVAVGNDDSLYVCYVANGSPGKLRVAKLTLSGSTYSKASEEDALTAASGYVFGACDIDVCETGSGTCIIVGGIEFTFGTTMTASMASKSTGGTWSGRVQLSRVSTARYGTDTKNIKLMPTFGPFAVACEDTLHQVGGATTFTRAYFLYRGAEQGYSYLTTIGVDTAGVQTAGSSGAGGKVTLTNFLSSVLGVKRLYGQVFTVERTPGVGTPGAIVALCSESGYYAVGQVNRDGIWAQPISTKSYVHGGVTPRMIQNIRTFIGAPGENDIKMVGISAGPDRVAFTVHREFAGHSKLVVVHAKINRDQVGAPTGVLWHASPNPEFRPSGTAYDSDDWRIIIVHNGANRHFAYTSGGVNMGRYGFTALRWKITTGGERAHFYYGVSRRPETKSTSYASAALDSPAHLDTIDDPTPAVSASFGSNGPDYPFLDAAPYFEVADDAGFTNVVGTGIEDFAMANSLSPGTLGSTITQRLPQDTLYGRYRMVDVHGLASAWAPLSPAPPNNGTVYTQFSVLHEPVATPTAPVNKDPIDSGSHPTARFDWDFTDPYAGDSQTAYQVQVKKVSDGSSLHDTGKTTSSDHFAGITGLTANADVKAWRVRVWDDEDVVAPWSDWAEFYYVLAPDLATLTVNATTPLPVVSWTYDTGTGHGGPTKYMVWVVDATKNELIFSSNEIVTNATSYTWTAPSPILTKGNTYKFVVLVWDTLNSSGMKEVTESTFGWPSPAQMTGVTVDSSVYETKGYVTISWSTTAEDADFIRYRVDRIITTPTPQVKTIVEIGDGKPFATVGVIDPILPSGTSAVYAVYQIADYYGTEIISAGATSSVVTVEGNDYWLVDPGAVGLNINQVSPSRDNGIVLVPHATADSFSEEYEEEFIELVGRGRKREIGTRLGYAGQLTASLNGFGNQDPRQQRRRLDEIHATLDELYLRSPFGDVMLVAIGPITYERVPGSGTIDRTTATIGYHEVVEHDG